MKLNLSTVSSPDKSLSDKCTINVFGYAGLERTNQQIVQLDHNWGKPDKSTGWRTKFQT
jgi:hypothetical protein